MIQWNCQVMTKRLISSSATPMQASACFSSCHKSNHLPSPHSNLCINYRNLDPTNVLGSADWAPNALPGHNPSLTRVRGNTVRVAPDRTR